MADYVQGRFIDMLEELQAVSAAVCTPVSNEHPGQLAWNSIFEGREAPAAIFDGRAYGFLESHDTLEFGGDPALLGDVLDWARGLSEGFTVTVAEGPIVDSLVRHGGTPLHDAPWFVQQNLSLGEIRIPQIAGYTFRHVEPGQLHARAACHIAAWSDESPSNMTDEMYGWLMRAPGYDSALDWVAVDDTGHMAASCNTWVCGEVALVEPVGCATAHRRRGLGGGVTLAALVAARGRGATVGVVRPRGDDGYPVPQLVYRSIGFTDGARTRSVRFDSTACRR